jgi:hypothetical protein
MCGGSVDGRADRRGMVLVRARRWCVYGVGACMVRCAGGAQARRVVGGAQARRVVRRQRRMVRRQRRVVRRQRRVVRRQRRVGVAQYHAQKAREAKEACEGKGGGGTRSDVLASGEEDELEKGGQHGDELGDGNRREHVGNARLPSHSIRRTMPSARVQGEQSRTFAGACRRSA